MESRSAEIHQQNRNGKGMSVVNISPSLRSGERDAQKRNIENRLYTILLKYTMNQA